MYVTTEFKFKALFQGPVTEHLYESLLVLYEKYLDPGLRGRILQCLGE
jgi:cohesin loading factor subunit SCC2